MTKLLKLTNFNEDIEEKVIIKLSFGQKCSFRHNLNQQQIKKKIFEKSFKAHQPKAEYGTQKFQIMQSFGHKCSFPHNLN